MKKNFPKKVVTSSPHFHGFNDAWSPSDGENSEMELYIEAGDMAPHNVEINLNLPPSISAQHQ